MRSLATILEDLWAELNAQGYLSKQVAAALELLALELAVSDILAELREDFLLAASDRRPLLSSNEAVSVWRFTKRTLSRWRTCQL